MIFQKPLTEEDPEGSAHLIRKQSEHGQLEEWAVRFVADRPGAQYIRQIKK